MAQAENLVQNYSKPTNELLQSIKFVNNNESAMSSMSMTFNNMLPMRLLFHAVEIKNTADLLWACCILFVVGVVYEWVKSTRISLFHTRNHWLFRRCGWIKEKSKSKQIILAPQLVEDNVCVCQTIRADAIVVKTNEDDRKEDDERRKRFKHISVHCVETLLFGVQLLLSYALMLAVMTYNVFVIASVVVGCMIGYFAINWPRTAKNKLQKRLEAAVIKQSDCH